MRVRKILFSLAGAGSSTYLDDALLHRHNEDLIRFVALAKEHGSDVRIVPYIHQIGDLDRNIYKRFVDEAHMAGLPLCSLEKAFAGYSIESLRVNSLDGHPNGLANRIAVETVFDCLFGAIEDFDG